MSTIAKELYNAISLPTSKEEKKRKLLKADLKIKSLSAEKIIEYRKKINDVEFMKLAIECLGERLSARLLLQGK